MPEKTLKEKVDEVAADDVELCLNRLLMLAKERTAAISAVSIIRFEIKKRDKALAALEERVKEVESENRSLDFWKDIIVKGNTLDIEQVKRELHDYHVILENVSKVYMHVTGGKVSKENTLAGVVCELADEHYEELYQEEAPDGK